MTTATMTIGTGRPELAWVWDCLRYPEYFRRLAAESNGMDRHLSIEERVAEEIARRERVALRLAGLPVPDPRRGGRNVRGLRRT
jgi:hypothetical protein